MQFQFQQYFSIKLGKKIFKLWKKNTNYSHFHLPNFFLKQEDDIDMSGLFDPTNLFKIDIFGINKIYTTR